MVKDLVCGMMVDTKHPGAKVTYQGKEYYFCHENCKKEFEQDPEHYIAQAKLSNSDSDKD